MPAELRLCCVVGYQTHGDFAEKYMLKAINFQGVSTVFNAQDVKINNGTGPAYGSDDWTLIAPQIMLRDEFGMYSTTYYFVCDGIPDGNGGYTPGWVDEFGYDVHDEIAIGQGFWIFDGYNATATYTLAGQVLDYDFMNTYALGYTLTANPFPMALNPNDTSKVDWGTLDGPDYGSDNWTEVASQIMVRDSLGMYSTTYYFVHDGIPDGDGGYTPGWVDEFGYDIQEAGIPAGAGFWFVNNDKEITVTYKH